MTAGTRVTTEEEIEIASHDIYFEPKDVTIPADTDVTIVLPNQGVIPHNFSIDALGVSVDLAPGATEETVINAPVGEYEFYCDVPGHKEAGMVGTLIVSGRCRDPGGRDARSCARRADPSRGCRTGRCHPSQHD